MKFSAIAQSEVKCATHSQRIFTRQKAHLIEKPTCRNKSVFCLWATKKIFLPFLRMNSTSCKNEILADARMKSANADEIFGFASDEIKSTHSPLRRISSNEVGFHCRRRFHPPARMDLVENDKFLSKLVVFWCT